MPRWRQGCVSANATVVTELAAKDAIDSSRSAADDVRCLTHDRLSSDRLFFQWQ